MTTTINKGSLSVVMSFTPYSDYRELQLPWLNKIPTHWETHKGKWLFTKMQRPVLPDYEVVTCFRDGMVTLRKNRRITGFTESIKEIGYQGVSKGDLVIHAMDAFAGAIGVSDSEGKCSPVYSICKPQEYINPHYYAHIVRLMSKSNYILSLAKGIRERSTDFRFSTFGNLLLPVPPKEEQDKIVVFLNFYLDKTNRFIRNKQKLIALLKEQKQNIINQAATRGIDPKARLKPSGIVWLGNIPEHWDILRCKFLFKERDERSKTGTETHLSMSQKYGVIPNSELSERRLLSESYAGAKKCYINDLVLNRLKAHLGVFSVSKYDGLVSPDYTVFQPIKEMEIEYFAALLKSPTYRAELRMRTRGIVEGFWRLYTDDYYDIPVPIPPVDEQKAILLQIKEEITEIDNVISRVDKEIEFIKEYQTRLISDVVTGKIDVRNIPIETVDEREDIALDEDEALEGEEELAYAAD